MLKKVLIALLIILIIMQFFHPARNIAEGEQQDHISKQYAVPADIKSILDKACVDCHSNNTVYPWYSKVQPVDWWMSDHILEGKRELNFDEFNRYVPRKQYHKLEELAKQVKDGQMPLNSYTWIHKKAILNDAEKQALIDWTGSLREQMRNKYPADSLEKPKSKK